MEQCARSAAVLGCGFQHRPGAFFPNWRRDAAITRWRGRPRCDKTMFPPQPFQNHARKRALAALILRYLPSDIGNPLRSCHPVAFYDANRSASVTYTYLNHGFHWLVRRAAFCRNELVFVGSFYNFGAPYISTLFSMVYKLDIAHFSQKRREPLHFGGCSSLFSHAYVYL